MLHLSRKVGDSVIINDTIEVTVLEIRGKAVKLGFEFPDNAKVFRREVYDRIKQENINAAKSTAMLQEALNED